MYIDSEVPIPHNCIFSKLIEMVTNVWYKEMKTFFSIWGKGWTFDIRSTNTSYWYFAVNMRCSVSIQKYYSFYSRPIGT